MEINICAICLNEIKLLSLITINCKHQFCYKCMTKWIISNPICPMDRNPITDLNIYHGDKFERTINIYEILKHFFNRMSLKCETFLKLSLVISNNQKTLLTSFLNDFQRNQYFYKKLVSQIDIINTFNQFPSKCSEKYLNKLFLQIRKSISERMRNLNKLLLNIKKYNFQCETFFNRLLKFDQQLNSMKSTSNNLISAQDLIKRYRHFFCNVSKTCIGLQTSLNIKIRFYQHVRSIILCKNSINEKLLNFKDLKCLGLKEN